jgi:tRNA threonylcarbamoyladenosine biosynthesis protein TsaB
MDKNLKLLLINSNIDNSFVALYSEPDLIISKTSDYIKDSDQQNLLRSTDKLIQCFSEVSQKLEEREGSLEELDAISVIIGPGSFTGIRVGMAIAKGAADALDKKIIPIDNFELTLNRIQKIEPGKKYCVLIPAKIPEYYFSVRKDGRELTSGTGEISSLTSIIDKDTVVVGNFSDESEFSVDYFKSLNVKDQKPELDSMLELSLQHYNSGKLFLPENIEPLYLKDFIAKRKN